MSFSRPQAGQTWQAADDCSRRPDEPVSRSHRHDHPPKTEESSVSASALLCPNGGVPCGCARRRRRRHRRAPGRRDSLRSPASPRRPLRRAKRSPSPPPPACSTRPRRGRRVTTTSSRTACTSGPRTTRPGRKAAGYIAQAESLSALVAAGEPTLDWTLDPGITAIPGKQVVVDFDGNGTGPDGILVGEPVYGANWWLSQLSPAVRQGRRSAPGRRLRVAVVRHARRVERRRSRPA